MLLQTLRILRPEGYMIWSMKTAQAEHSTEFGLFEQNLASLVKAGQCNISTDYLLTIYYTEYLVSADWLSTDWLNIHKL